MATGLVGRPISGHRQRRRRRPRRREIAHERPPTTPAGRHVRPDAPAVVINHLDITDTEVVTEARRWSTGRRGATVGRGDGRRRPQRLRRAGHGCRSAGHRRRRQRPGHLRARAARRGSGHEDCRVQQLRRPTPRCKAAAGAAETMGKAADEARKAIAETEAATTQGRSPRLSSASTKALRDEVERLVGGENPELLARLAPVLDAAGRKMGEQAFEQTDKLLDEGEPPVRPRRPDVAIRQAGRGTRRAAEGAHGVDGQEPPRPRRQGR